MVPDGGRLHDNQQIYDLQQYLNSIYAANNEIPVESILGRITEAISEVASPFDAKGVSSSFIKALSWYFAFCNRVEINTQTAAIGRYPRICPSCLSEICVCERTYKQPPRAQHLAGSRDEELKIRAESLINAAKIPHTEPTYFDLNWFAHNLLTIYPVNRARWRVNRFYFPAKMLRELGKLANGFRRYRNTGNSPVQNAAKERLASDAADFFAWLIGYWTLSEFETDPIDIQRKFLNHYSIGCPYCDQLPCRCPSSRRFGNRAEFVAFSLSNAPPQVIEQLNNRIAELSESLSPFPELAKELTDLGNKKRFSPGAMMDFIQKATELLRLTDVAAGHGQNIFHRLNDLSEFILRTFNPF